MNVNMNMNMNGNMNMKVNVNMNMKMNINMNMTSHMDMDMEMCTDNSMAMDDGALVNYVVITEKKVVITVYPDIVLTSFLNITFSALFF
jgi:hypothetical protein